LRLLTGATIMDTREMFVKGIAADANDEQLRLAYADWLEEQGEYEEAEQQRSWTRAKAWIINLCEENPDFDAESPEDVYAYLMTSVGRSGSISRDYILCGNRELLTRALNQQKQEFWKNWSIVTGRPIPHHFAKTGGRFRCAC
jgi:uncharacterized protein (TIGR02996 family)